MRCQNSAQWATLKVILMGDLNSRTNMYPDYVNNDDVQYVPVHANYIADKYYIYLRS